jgi:nicotinamide mononucleotide transporter
MGLNGYYFFISIYGWITWANKKNSNKAILHVSRAGLKMIFIILFSIAILFFLLGYVLENYTDSPLPYWDSLTTAGSIVATWMLAKKILEHWIIWVIVDLIAFGLYINKGLYPTAVLFAVYTAMAIVGYLQWNRTFKKYKLA